MPNALEVISPGLLSLIEDLGRVGFGRQGVGRSGAFDRASHRQAQQLVGNDDAAAGIEVLLGGVSFRLTSDAAVATTGARVELNINGQTITQDRAHVVRAGQVVSLGRCTNGLRSYVAVAGGLDVDATLASRSTDLLSELGPPALKAGDRIPIGIPGIAPNFEWSQGGGTHVPSHIDRRAKSHDPCTLRVIVGPRDDWFRFGALTEFLDGLYVVDPASNRIAVRLRGPEISRTEYRELPSEPTIPGAIQIPPNGLPLIFGPDAPVTGGYPVIAVVVDDDLDLLAQCRPGQAIRFEPLS